MPVSIYKAPFQYPDEDLVPTEALKEWLEDYNIILEHNFDAEHDNDKKHTIMGTLQNLEYFMMDIMCELTRDWFDCGAWSKDVQENYKWNPSGLGPGVGCYV